MSEIKMLRNVAGHDWGWGSTEDQQMHIQTLDAKFRSKKTTIHIWLECQGERIFELHQDDVGKIKPDPLNQVHTAVDQIRGDIEDAWTIFIMSKRWINPVLLPNGIIDLRVYRDHNTFSRFIDLQRDVGLAARAITEITQNDIGLNREICALTIFRKQAEDRQIHGYLPKILWLDPPAKSH